MDFLLIVVAIGGFVTAIVMLVLASRANRLQDESDERVETLEAMATGSILFAHASPAPRPEPEAHSARVTMLEPAPLAPASQPALADDLADDLDLALNEFADEEELTAGDSSVTKEPRTVTPATIAVTASAYPFVMTVPAAAGAGRVQISFDRSRSRSRS